MRKSGCRGKDGMLNRRESEVMKRVYSLCQDKGICLVTAAELLSGIKRGERWSESDLEKTLLDLKADHYFDLLYSERKGERTYVITLNAEGYAYPRTELQLRRNFTLKMLWAATSATVAFLVGWVLKHLF